GERAAAAGEADVADAVEDRLGGVGQVVAGVDDVEPAPHVGGLRRSRARGVGNRAIARDEQLHLLEPADLVADGDQRLDLDLWTERRQRVVGDVRPHAVRHDDQRITGARLGRRRPQRLAYRLHDLPWLLTSASGDEVDEDVAEEVRDVRLDGPAQRAPRLAPAPVGDGLADTVDGRAQAVPGALRPDRLGPGGGRLAGAAARGARRRMTLPRLVAQPLEELVIVRDLEHPGGLRLALGIRLEYHRDADQLLGRQAALLDGRGDQQLDGLREVLARDLQQHVARLRGTRRLLGLVLLLDVLCV